MTNLFISESEKKLLVAEIKDELRSWDKVRFGAFGAILAICGFLGFETIISSIVDRETKPTIDAATSALIRAEIVGDNNLLRATELRLDMAEISAEIEESLSSQNTRFDDLSKQTTDGLLTLSETLEFYEDQFTQLDRQFLELDEARFRIEQTYRSAGKALLIEYQPINELPSNASCGLHAIDDLINSQDPKSLGCGRLVSRRALDNLATSVSIETMALRAFLDVFQVRPHGHNPNGHPMLRLDRDRFIAAIGGDLRAAVDAAQLPDEIRSILDFRVAYRIAPDAALEQTEWGMTRIRGADYADAGFTSPAALVQEIYINDENQVYVMLSLLERRNALDGFSSENWSKLYRAMRRDVDQADLDRIKTRYDIWIDRDIRSRLRSPQTPLEIANMKSALATLGFLDGASQDTLIGFQTRQAIEAFQIQHNLSVDGVPGTNTLAALEVAMEIHSLD
ncbi:peptidoglycan-binding domain-containing protein [Yoonia sp. 208BN28-4]|uniref:peptidoglycan-binding domain-containing protein n=1 Tax=Yoonia sp. 208BN28-4 TaxID=3126505 RepID=UPI0030A64596